MRLTSLAPLVALSALVLAGCSSTPSCGGDEKYLKAQERPKLNLPPGVFGSERIQPIVIPPASPDPLKLDPEPQCLDYPPQYFARKGPAQGSAEATVRAWAAAWAERKPDAVLQAYATDFQPPPGSAGSSAFLTEREEQVATGAAPSPVIEDLTVTVVGDDRRIATFTQTFGDQRVRRELTLQRDGQNWRIVAERTLGAP